VSCYQKLSCALRGKTDLGAIELQFSLRSNKPTAFDIQDDEEREVGFEHEEEEEPISRFRLRQVGFSRFAEILIMSTDRIYFV